MKSLCESPSRQGHAGWKLLRKARGVAFIILVTMASGIAATGASIEKEPEDYNANLNESAKFSVTPFPPGAQVRWFKAGNTNSISDSKEFKIGTVSMRDVGFYYCTVGEDGAVVSRAVALTVYSNSVLSKKEGVLNVTVVPISVPYPGSGYGTSGVCGPYVGAVRFPRPGSNPPSYNWVPPARTDEIRLRDVTVGPPGYQTSLSILQNYPPVQRCQSGPGPLSMPVVQGCGYALWLYVTGPSNFAGTVINVEISWVTRDLSPESTNQN